ncbi:MAG: RNA polymerase sigma-70 factor [Cyclobacteriaceae bacterium]
MNSYNRDIVRSLVAQTQNGRQDSYKELYVIFAPKLFYFSRKYKLSVEDCEGVVQEVFLKIWEKREGLNPDLSFNAYVMLIAKNIILNKFKKQVNEQAYLTQHLHQLKEHADQTEAAIVNQDLEQIACRAIESLPEKRRNIYKLSRERGLSNQEIAENLNISKSTVENQINKALKFLKLYLEQNAEIQLDNNQS